MKLQAPTHRLTGHVALPISKSIANRYLIISALANAELALPTAHMPVDVAVLSAALASTKQEINIGMAGTAMRFLTAYFAVQEGREVVLTGDQRMKQRPISELVEALRALGAHIYYLENHGYPPLKILGKKLKGGAVQVDAGISSQFVSALMMVGPRMQNGLQIELKGKVLSRPYIELTRTCMHSRGAQVALDGAIISIPPSDFNTNILDMETDWSAASYFYALAAAKPHSKLMLKGLNIHSAQGDAVLVDWFRQMGLESEQKESGVEITSPSKLLFPSVLDFTANPDLAQTFAFLAAALAEKLTLTGLDNLRLKETDRIAAVQTELEKLGVHCSVRGNSMEVSGGVKSTQTSIKTYNDHRMAMAASLVAVRCHLPAATIEIEHPKVVEKSYPAFWEQLQQLGFTIH